MSKTAPAPASGDVVVPREKLEALLKLLSRRVGVVEIDMAQAAISELLASAPRPSGDVAAKLPDIFACNIGNDGRIRIIDLCYTAFMRAKEEHGNPDDNGPFDWFTDTYPDLVKAIGGMAGEYRALTERIATLEQERTARDAECASLRAALELERWGINEIGSGLSSESAYGIAQSVIARRALGEQP